MLRVRLAADFFPFAPDALCGAVARFSIAPRAVNLNEHCVVDVRTKIIFDGAQIGVLTIRGELNAVRKASC